jgi:protein-S-isoprenylcysteine O-methyltransferase Ste14
VSHQLEREEIDMNTGTHQHSKFFYSALAAVAMLGPILLVFAAGTLPEGVQQRGNLIVHGHEVLLAILAAALALRAAYTMGFSKALKIVRSQQQQLVRSRSRRSVAA